MNHAIKWDDFPMFISNEHQHSKLSEPIRKIKISLLLHNAKIKPQLLICYFITGERWVDFIFLSKYISVSLPLK